MGDISFLSGVDLHSAINGYHLPIGEMLLKQFNIFAKLENRSLSNFIETATKKYINEIELTDTFETKEILDGKLLLKKIAKGRKDAKARRGKFVKV